MLQIGIRIGFYILERLINRWINPPSGESEDLLLKLSEISENIENLSSALAAFELDLTSPGGIVSAKFGALSAEGV